MNKRRIAYTLDREGSVQVYSIARAALEKGLDPIESLKAIVSIFEMVAEAETVAEVEMVAEAEER